MLSVFLRAVYKSLLIALFSSILLVAASFLLIANGSPTSAELYVWLVRDPGSAATDALTVDGDLLLEPSPGIQVSRDVAFKILVNRDGGDPAAATRFQREAQAVAALNHPGIVTIHAMEESDGATSSADEAVAAAEDASVPIGVMDPGAYDDRLGSDGERSSWEEPAAPARATAGSGLGNTTAVRLLRTVAPWTAPSGEDQRHDAVD